MLQQKQPLKDIPKIGDKKIFLSKPMKFTYKKIAF